MGEKALGVADMKHPGTLHCSIGAGVVDKWKLYASGDRSRLNHYSGAFQSVNTDYQRFLEGDYADKVAFVDRWLGIQEIHVVNCCGLGVLSCFLRCVDCEVGYSKRGEVLEEVGALAWLYAVIWQ